VNAPVFTLIRLHHTKFSAEDIGLVMGLDVPEVRRILTSDAACTFSHVLQALDGHSQRLNMMELQRQGVRALEGIVRDKATPTKSLLEVLELLMRVEPGG
jgi:hypothetical protein